MIPTTISDASRGYDRTLIVEQVEKLQNNHTIINVLIKKEQLSKSEFLIDMLLVNLF